MSKCKSCRWFKPVKNGKGECRYHAPRAVQIPIFRGETRVGTVNMNFPIVGEDDFCRKWGVSVPEKTEKATDEAGDFAKTELAAVMRGICK